jgi:hypothetical protein
MKFGFFIEKYFKEIYANCFCNCAIVRNASKPTLADFADVELAPSSSVVRPNRRRSVKPPRLIASKEILSPPNVSSSSYTNFLIT